MTAPAQTEQQALERLISALAYATSAQVVAQALSAFPDVAAEGIKLLMTIPQVRGLMRLAPEGGAHAAVHAMYRQNLIRRAAYLAVAARRMSTAARLGPAERDRALDAERRYLTLHLAADAGRTIAAQRVAATARQVSRAAKRVSQPWSGLLGWYAVMDERTSAECRRANGRNFDPTKIPPIGLPGTVHPHCRCKPGPPFPSSDGGSRGYYRVEDIKRAPLRVP